MIGGTELKVGIGDMKFIGLENYVRMFQDETFREAVVNNLKFVVLGSLFQLCAGLILAILLTHISKGGNILRVIYFIPQSAINSYPGTLTQNPTSN